MNNKHFSIVLGIISTLLFLALLPHLIQDFFKEDVSIWKRLSYLATPFFVSIMWHHILKLLKNGNTQNSGRPENNNANI
ncbi:MAG: hypothetical protein Q8L88_01025 [Bacteroidota bacterium]|nr:hypothetical protein [Bacteroidota bacterium]